MHLLTQHFAAQRIDVTQAASGRNTSVQKYRNSSRGQISRSNIIDIQSFLALITTDIPTELHKSVISSCSVFVQTHTHRLIERLYRSSRTLAEAQTEKKTT